MTSRFILYVRDQQTSTAFYRKVLALEPSLNVPGMTEFQLSEHCILGLMPEKGIKDLLGDSIQDPEKTNGAARAELYLEVVDPELYLNRAQSFGARILSPFMRRNWGDEACYVADPDGHVVAFARNKMNSV
ncbi:MAG: VOC family protein [Bdellovibrionales bacterium]